MPSSAAFRFSRTRREFPVDFIRRAVLTLFLLNMWIPTIALCGLFTLLFVVYRDAISLAALNWTLSHLFQLPNWIAIPFSRRLIKRQHYWDSNSCMACLGKERLQHAQHSEATGPHSQYCSKCGLDKHAPGTNDIVWPPYCANRVVKVNNPTRRSRVGAALQRLAFWD